MQDNEHDSFMTAPEMAARFRISRLTVLKLENDLGFPKGAVFGRRLLKWRASEVLEWINERIAARAGGAPVDDPVAVRFLDAREVRKRVDLSRQTVWRLECDGDFPKAVTISKGRRVWIEAEIRDWLNERFGVRRRGEGE